MIHSRQDREILEHQSVAPYAARSATSRGRLHPEDEHLYRTAFQRDRDRIIHSPSFRRLEYKTQVFVNGTADHYRTRLTHTMEMTSIGRNIARTLRANEDLTEAIALAHDIGHSPFGHVGERELDDLMKNEGGFDHNIQSLRWVELLEPRYPTFPGLNLTWEVRAGLRKHLAQVQGAELDGLPIGPYQFVEGQIADVADDVSYHAHDVEDGLEAGLLTLDMLHDLELWRKALERADENFPHMSENQRYSVAIRYTLELQVQDIVRESEKRLRKHAPSSPEDVMNAPERIVTFGQEMNALLQPFRAFLFENVYWHPSVANANNEAVQMMRRLFLHYVEKPEDMGRKAKARIEQEGVWRTACDYVSGMTDRYALEEYATFNLDQE